MRQEAVEATLERNPNAFRPKIANSPGIPQNGKVATVLKFIPISINVICIRVSTHVDLSTFYSTSKFEPAVLVFSLLWGYIGRPFTSLYMNDSNRLEFPVYVTNFIMLSCRMMSGIATEVLQNITKVAIAKSQDA